MRTLLQPILMAAALCFAFLPGCASSPDLPPQARTGLSEIRSALSAAGDQLEDVAGSLERLDSMRGETSALINDYLTNLASLERTLETTRARLSSVRGPEGFFAAWEEDIDEIADRELRREAEDRYDVTRRALDRVNNEIDSLRSTFAPMYRDMQDLATYLENDPTLAGIEEAGESVRRLLGQKKDVMSKLNTVQRSISSLL